MQYQGKLSSDGLQIEGRWWIDSDPSAATFVAKDCSSCGASQRQNKPSIESPQSEAKAQPKATMVAILVAQARRSG